MEATKQMKPSNGKEQAATKVNVLSPENTNIREADSFHVLEGSTWRFAKARNVSFPRGLRQWHVLERKWQELGRPKPLHVRESTRNGWVVKYRARLIRFVSPLLAPRTKRHDMVVGDKQERRGTNEGCLGVGPIHSRGVAGVMPCESVAHSKGSAVVCRGKEQHVMYKETT